jgi:hypothetical protein
MVLAGELADERGRADAGIFFVCGTAGGGCGRRRSERFFSCRWRSGRSGRSGLGGRGNGRATSFANHSNDGVDLNRVTFGNLDFLEDPAGGRGDFGVDLVGGNLEQRHVALDLVTGFF